MLYILLLHVHIGIMTSLAFPPVFFSSFSDNLSSRAIFRFLKNVFFTGGMLHAEFLLYRQKLPGLVGRVLPQAVERASVWRGRGEPKLAAAQQGLGKLRGPRVDEWQTHRPRSPRQAPSGGH